MDTVDGRYRVRTMVRGGLPLAFAKFVPKGGRDCGAHEWYRSDAETWRCYHCEPGSMIGESPWTWEERLQLSLAGVVELLRAMQHRPLGVNEIDELRRLTAEIRELLPGEAERLEKLAEAEIADLPGVAARLDAVPG